VLDSSIYSRKQVSTVQIQQKQRPVVLNNFRCCSSSKGFDSTFCRRSLTGCNRSSTKFNKTEGTSNCSTNIDASLMIDSTLTVG
jgi:hypothetical protein